MYKHNINKLALAGTAALGIVVSSATNAAVIDRPVFKILGAVVVWGGDGSGSAATVDDFIIKPEATNIDLIDGDVTPVITGSLTSYEPTGSDAMLSLEGTSLDSNSDGVLDASDAVLSSFSPDSSIGHTTSNHQSSFYVASNTNFVINASATLLTAQSTPDAQLSDITRTMTVNVSGNAGSISYGSRAQHPHSTSGGITNNGTLNNLSTEQIVFAGDRRTATSSGTIAQQSVEFTNSYSLSSTAGLESGMKTVAAEVTYTVAIP